MTQSFNIPADLVDSDLVMSQIKSIKEIRTVAQHSQSVLDGPGPEAVRMAKARIVWAKDAEAAVIDKKPVPPKPGRKADEADPEDYLGDE